mmetsp:Transcript_21642/g.47546  ORF Transcript_21642/g.47546 Transcript_21642/m.47546 type:complete len:498 (-) Transcript_21642:300-1793(-)|eukprot:CAMPEP_0118924534 /NCGR_PEP_ID=MMETSP1169-20130426/2627_1 /TAXON_ID=36882 /ORGANISM="Pyramimonas obovata, Strain CCMP722" /LENGTH=497 /DNA_ID=CAMNT_0006865657 /DNA_START=163 /DNA_END=1656 /DNA_ORIENTATION=+
MAGFSGAVKIADLTDYIAPSQDCIVIETKTKAGRLVLEDDLEPGEVQINSRVKEAINPDAKFQAASEPVKINLQDCLACSGCVTTAETILLEQQSTGEFMSKLGDVSDTHVVVSISPQSRASLAAYFKTTPEETFEKVASFLKSLGVQAVLDTTAARQVARMEAAADFVHRFRASAAPRPPSQPPPGPLPVLASSCPGWVCYAEKTHGTYVLPYISTVKSPQAIMGTVVKRHLAAKWGVPPEKIYHVSVMPCADKKLEAARDDFFLPGTTMPEVDCVLTSLEVLQLLQERAVDFDSLHRAPIDQLFDPLTTTPAPQPAPEAAQVEQSGTSGSGGYLDYVFRHAAREVGGVEVRGPLALKTLRNTDFREAVLEVDGKVVLRFAAVYGFRNIQNILRKIKTNKCEYHYVEVMACPSGCLNGGGQVRPDAATKQTPKELLEQVELAYDRIPSADPAAEAGAAALYGSLVAGGCFSERARELLHTRYHHREKTAAMTVANW